MSDSITLGTGSFFVNLWLNMQDWTWNGNTWVDLGTDGCYGEQMVSGTQTISASTALSGGFLTGTEITGNYVGITIQELIDGKCPHIDGTTPFILWMGIVNQPNLTNTATITSIAPIANYSSVSTTGVLQE